MKQGEQAWLLAGELGNHEFSRAFWQSVKGRPAAYSVRDGTSRVGPNLDLLHLAVDADGAWLTWTGGLRSHIPRDWYQLSWRP